MSKDSPDIERNLDVIESKLARALEKSGRRRDDVQIVAVSKKQPVEKILAYLNLCNIRGNIPIIGENYVQEFQEKKKQLPTGVRSHLIGPLQRNKVRDALFTFDVIQSVHRLEILELIDKEAIKRESVQEIFLQVNISSDDDKSGFSPDKATEVIQSVLPKLSRIRCLGLMTITKLYQSPEDARPDFAKLRELGADLTKILGYRLLLSMGMSSDFDIAVEEGATHIRVGTALFGERVE